jgi:glutamine amidotransferase
MGQKIAIVDYGMGNLNSVKRKLNRIRTDATITSDPDIIANADKIILPGVGHFQMAMENLARLNLIQTINDAVFVRKKPILGICLGMQLMAGFSEEGNVAGLGWFDARVVKFNVSNPQLFKIPHMGWNQIEMVKESLIMKNIAPNSEFYFVHSYHFVTNCITDILNETEYDYKFVSAVEKENIFGVQYHPEKSHDVGEQLLKNFVDL